MVAEYSVWQQGFSARNNCKNRTLDGEWEKMEDIAEDFGAYYDLYNKYRDDYGINNILEGNATPDIYRRMVEADYDERLTVVNLLLDTLNKHF